MKKKLIILALILFAGVGLVKASAYNAKQQKVIDTFTNWCTTPTVRDIAFWTTYKTNQWGTLEQNLERRDLQKWALPVDDSGKTIPPCNQNLGSVPFLPSKYKTTLATTLSANITPNGAYTIGLGSITTPEGHTLVTADFGSNPTIPFHINPAGSSDEIVICTGMSTTTSATTGCTRGYNTYNTSYAIGNVKYHGIGETVIISNDVHFFANQFVNVYDDQTIVGSKTFTGVNIFTNPPIGVFPTTTNQLATKGYADGIAAGGFSASNIGDGKTLRANGTSPETVDVNTSTPDLSFLIEEGKFEVATGTGSKIDTLWKNNYNATTTKANLTISHDLTVNGTNNILYSSVMAGETISGLTTPVSIFIATSTNSTTTSQLTGDSFYHSYASNDYSQTFTTGSHETKIYSVKLNLGKVGSPTGNYTVYIYNTNGTIPTTAISGASATLSSSDLVADPLHKDYEFVLNSRPTLSANTKYAIVLIYLTGDASNYIWFNYKSATNPYTVGQAYKNLGAGWVATDSADDDFLFQVIESFENGKAYTCDTTLLINPRSGRYDGFAKSNATANTLLNAQLFGAVGGFTGLTSGGYYFIQNDTTIGTSAGTVQRYAGFAVSTTTLLMGR